MKAYANLIADACGISQNDEDGTIKSHSRDATIPEFEPADGVEIETEETKNKEVK